MSEEVAFGQRTRDLVIPKSGRAASPPAYIKPQKPACSPAASRPEGNNHGAPGQAILGLALPPTP